MNCHEVMSLCLDFKLALCSEKLRHTRKGEKPHGQSRRDRHAVGLLTLYFLKALVVLPYEGKNSDLEE